MSDPDEGIVPYKGPSFFEGLSQDLKNEFVRHLLGDEISHVYAKRALETVQLREFTNPGRLTDSDETAPCIATINGDGKKLKLVIWNSVSLQEEKSWYYEKEAENSTVKIISEMEAFIRNLFLSRSGEHISNVVLKCRAFSRHDDGRVGELGRICFLCFLQDHMSLVEIQGIVKSDGYVQENFANHLVITRFPYSEDKPRDSWRRIEYAVNVHGIVGDGSWDILQGAEELAKYDERLKAFFMGWHGRLGRDSLVGTIDPDIGQKIVEQFNKCPTSSAEKLYFDRCKQALEESTRLRENHTSTECSLMCLKCNRPVQHQ